MEKILLDCEQRSITGKKVKHLRRLGYVPGVVYGHYTEPIALKVQERALHQALMKAGATRLITLTVKGIKDPKMVLARDLQRDVISHAAVHVDFYEVTMTERLQAQVPIILLGEPLPVTNGEGILFQSLDALEVECLPADLPPAIEVSLNQLTVIEQAILVRDLQLSEAVQVLVDPDEVVVKVLPLEAELVEEEIAVEEVPEVEVEGEEGEPPTAEAAEKADEEED